MRLLSKSILGASGLAAILICLHSFSSISSAAQPQQNTPSSPAVDDDVSLALLPAPDPAAVARGKQIFAGNCAFCHGANATGGDTGPDLVRSAVVLHDEGKGTSIAVVLKNGRPERGMPRFDFSDAQIKDLAAFLLSRNQAAANRDTYQVLNLLTGDSKRGAAYFKSHCASCHSVTGDLAHVASKFTAAALQERFLYPARTDPAGANSVPDPRAQKTGTVTLSSGESYSGILVQYDDFFVALTDAAGQYHAWSLDGKNGIRVKITDPLEGHVKLLYQYANSDIHDVLAYLETLR